MSGSTGQPDILANIRGWAPPDLIVFLDQLVVLLPNELKYRLKVVLDAIPPEGDSMHKVLELVRSQWKSLQSEEWTQIAVVGPARTGKSTLIRTIAGQQEADSPPLFAIADLRGLDEYLGYGSGQKLPEELGEASVIVLVLDGRYEVADSTRQMYSKLKGLGKPVLVILNKMDLVKDRRKALRQAEAALNANVFGLSAWEDRGVEKLLKAVVVANPKTLHPLTRSFPEFRRTICKGITTQSSFAAAVISAIPIPVSDLLPITAVQTAMILKIARAFGFRLNRGRARELLPMLAAGTVVREGAHRLRKRFPGYSDLIAVSAAGGWTFLLGHAAIQYFDHFTRTADRLDLNARIEYEHLHPRDQQSETA